MRHLKNIGTLSPKQLFLYVWERSRNHTQQYLSSKFNKLIHYSIRLLQLIFHIPIPVFHRHYYMKQIYKNATKQYFPKKFCGRTLLWQNAEHRKQFDWATLIEGDLEFHECIEGHAEFADPQFSSIWAKTVKDSLEKV